MGRGFESLQAYQFLIFFCDLGVISINLPWFGVHQRCIFGPLIVLEFSAFEGVARTAASAVRGSS